MYGPFSRRSDRPQNTPACRVDQIDVLHESLYNGTDCGILAIYSSCPRGSDDNDATVCVVSDNKGVLLRAPERSLSQDGVGASHTNQGFVWGEYDL